MHILAELSNQVYTSRMPTLKLTDGRFLEYFDNAISSTSAIVFRHALRPALVPLTFDSGMWEPFVELAGVALPVLSRGSDANAPWFDEDLLFTHRGLSGPAVLQASTYWNPGKPITLNLSGKETDAAALQTGLLQATLGAKANADNWFAAQVAHWPKRLVQAWLNKPELQAIAGRKVAELGKKQLGPLAQALAKEMGLKLSLLPFDAGEKMDDDLRNMVWRGHYLGYGPADVMMHVPVDKFLMVENRQALIFAPYSREVLVVFHALDRLPSIQSGLDLQDMPLAAERGSGAASTLIGFGGGRLRSQVKMFNSGIDAAHAVLKGEAVAAYVSRAHAETALRASGRPAAAYGLTQLTLPGLADNGWPIGMAVKSSHKQLAHALEAALQKVRADGRLLGMFRERGLTLVAP